jgi:hypothetical protein
METMVTDRDEVPAAPPEVDRRKSPDRRAVWRGGRRDADWIHRPPGALSRLTEPGKPTGSRWRDALATLHFW